MAVKNSSSQLFSPQMQGMNPIALDLLCILFWLAVTALFAFLEWRRNHRAGR